MTDVAAMLRNRMAGSMQIMPVEHTCALTGDEMIRVLIDITTGDKTVCGIRYEIVAVTECEMRNDAGMATDAFPACTDACKMDDNDAKARLSVWQVGDSVTSCKPVEKRKTLAAWRSHDAPTEAKVGSSLAKGMGTAVTKAGMQPLTAQAIIMLIELAARAPKRYSEETVRVEGFKPLSDVAVAFNAAQIGELTTAIYGRNRVDRRIRLLSLLRSLQTEFTMDVPMKSGSRYITITVFGQLITVEGFGKRVSDGVEKKCGEGDSDIDPQYLNIRLSKVFYLCLERYHRIGLSAFRKHARGKNGNEYVYMRNYLAGEWAAIAAATKMGKHSSVLVPWTVVPAYRSSDTKEWKRKSIRGNMRAIAAIVAKDERAASWKVTSEGIIFTW